MATKSSSSRGRRAFSLLDLLSNTINHLSIFPVLFLTQRPGQTQAHYEKVAVVIYEYIQALIIEKFGFERLLMKRTGTDVFRSQGAENRDAMLVIICGTGQVMVSAFGMRVHLRLAYPVAPSRPRA